MRPPAEKLLARFIPPMLATLADAPPEDPEDWVAEVKYDGFRALAGLASGKVAMLSRNGLDLAGRFPEIAEALAEIVVGDAVIDGEAVAVSAAGGGEFQRLQNAGAEIAYFAFDLLWLNGEDLRDRPLEERRDLLISLLSNAPPVLQVAERVELPPAEALEEAKRRGIEGVIVKRRGSTWTAGRSREWLKLKAQNSQELAIIGYLPHKPTAKTKTGGLGALLLAVAEKGGRYRFAGKVGTGFSEKVRAQIKKLLDKDRIEASPAEGVGRIGRAVWARPRLVGQVSFTEWTDDGKLRHPSFQGLRLDKKPEECVREKPTRVTKAKAARKKAPAKKTAAKKTTAKTATRRNRKDDDAVPPGSSAAVEVQLTNPQKLLYPADGITKADVAAYYEAVAPAMLAALAGRPLSLQHWPAGIDKPSWFHQNMERDAPDWMRLVETPTSTKRGRIKHMIADRPESLRWLAQQNALTVHMWSSRDGRLNEPDWVLFDLDPAEGRGIDQAIEAALRLKPLLDELGLESVIKTSGKRGLHVFVPLGPGHSHEQTTDFAVRLGEGLVAQYPELLTLERALAKRNGRLYFDCFQNGYGKTVVAPYSTRAAPGAPVSAPLSWSEVNAKLDPSRFNVKTMPARLAEKGDLFAPALRGTQKLPKLR